MMPPDAADPADLDGDGIGVGDNCPTVANHDQTDSDGDGVGDACDNCPMVANPPKATLGFDHPIQRDHDGDGRGDECDLCPHIASVTPDADADGDGIGDACDPEPNVKNPPAYFNGFYDPPDATWKVPGGAGNLSDWDVERRDDGTIGWRQKVLDGSNRHQLIRDGEKQEHYIDSVIVVESIAQRDATSDLRGADLTFGFFPVTGANVYFDCGVLHNAQNNQDAIVVESLREDTPQDTNSSMWKQPVIGSRIHVTGTATRTNSTQPRMGESDLVCTAGPGAPVTASKHVNLFPDGQIGLRTFGMTAWFDYVFYVETVPAP